MAPLLNTNYYHNAVMQEQLHRPEPGSLQVLRSKVQDLLCPSELQFLLLSIGHAHHSGEAMAKLMKVKPSTIEHYRKHAAHETGARTRFDMLHFAWRIGLV